jgi:hypothetical protein
VTVDQCILVATIIAILLSPIIALLVTNKVSEWREARNRRYGVLRDLMATRRARLDPAHVAALNLVELEVYKRTQVRSAYKAYVKHLSTPPPQESPALDTFLTERNDLFSELLVEVARDLGYAFDKSDLSKLGYQPEAFANHFDDQITNSRLLRAILEGRRALPIRNFVEAEGMFPPAPKPKQIEK